MASVEHRRKELKNRTEDAYQRRRCITQKIIRLWQTRARKRKDASTNGSRTQQQAENLTPEIRHAGRGQFPRHLPVCRKQQGNGTGKDITDYEAYFIGCYRKAALVKIRKEKQVHTSQDDFFLRCGEEAKFISEDDLNGCERLVKDIRRLMPKFPSSISCMFMLRFYEAQFSFKALAECMGISAVAISQKVCRIVDAVRTHGSFAWRSQMLA